MRRTRLPNARAPCSHEKKGTSKMPRLTKEMYWLAQDIFCRYVAQCELAPKGDIKQIAQTCIALTSEFFAAFESTQQALSKSEQRALARDLPNALSQAL